MCHLSLLLFLLPSLFYHPHFSSKFYPWSSKLYIVFYNVAFCIYCPKEGNNNTFTLTTFELCRQYDVVWRGWPSQPRQTVCRPLMHSSCIDNEGELRGLPPCSYFINHFHLLCKWIAIVTWIGRWLTFQPSGWLAIFLYVCMHTVIMQLDR